MASCGVAILGGRQVGSVCWLAHACQLAVLGPGEAAKLDALTWSDGRTYRAILDPIIRIVELPDFTTLPRWFQALAEPH